MSEAKALRIRKSNTAGSRVLGSWVSSQTKRQVWIRKLVARCSQRCADTFRKIQLRLNHREIQRVRLAGTKDSGKTTACTARGSTHGRMVAATRGSTSTTWIENMNWIMNNFFGFGNFRQIISGIFRKIWRQTHCTVNIHIAFHFLKTFAKFRRNSINIDQHWPYQWHNLF